MAKKSDTPHQAPANTQATTVTNQATSNNNRLTPAAQRAMSSNVQPPKLKLIGDKFSASTDWTGDIAHAKFAIRRTANEPRYQVEIDFDFSGLTTEELRELAMSEVRIRTQAKMRAMSPNVWHTMTRVSVKDDLMAGNRQRGPVDRWQRIRRDMAAVGTPESVIEQLIANMKAAMAANEQSASDEEQSAEDNE